MEEELEREGGIERERKREQRKGERGGIERGIGT